MGHDALWLVDYKEQQRLRFQIRFDVLRLVGFAEAVTLTEDERESLHVSFFTQHPDEAAAHARDNW